MSDEEREIEQWKEFVKRTKLTRIPFPYFLTIGAVTIAGVFNLEDPLENSSTEGAAAGAVIGTYKLDRNNGEARLYDPTGNLLRLVMVLDFPGKELKARLDIRRWDGKWSEGSWVIIWRG